MLLADEHGGEEVRCTHAHRLRMYPNHKFGVTPAVGEYTRKRAIMLDYLNSVLTFPPIHPLPQHVPNILVKALFSALVIVNPYTLFTLTHMREYMQ
jgi:hypothetical protein